MIRASLSSLVRHEERTALRRLINFGARMRAAAAPVEIVVLNISPGGFLASGAGKLKPGEDAWIRLPGLEARRCQVMRHVGNDTAFEFFDPVRESDLAHLRRVRGRGPRRSDFGRRDPA